jgi:hypothetical protein
LGDNKTIIEKFNQPTEFGTDWKRIASERRSDGTEEVAADSIGSTQSDSQSDSKNRNEIRTNGKPFSPVLRALR